jgi:SAM-dependent methyltransferase
MPTQVDRKIYYDEGYVNPVRFAVYSYQISEIFKINPNNVLEIGIGNGLVSDFLKKAQFNVVTMDIDYLLNPSFVGSIINIPLIDESFDVVTAFQVLEHIPFEYFKISLNELKRISRKNVIMSLPDSSRHYKIQFVLPFIREISYSFQVPCMRPKNHIFDGQHYWEIGKKGYSIDCILDCIKSVGFEVLKNYRIFEHPYHRLFILKKIY